MTETGRPKCIVLPFQGAGADGAGLALHFLLGNVIAVHPGFDECWFGWRVARIFPTPAGLAQFCGREEFGLCAQQLSATQKIRYWMHGRIRSHCVALHLYDGRTQLDSCEELSFSVSDQLIGFRRGALRLLDRWGVPMAEARHPPALWPEKISGPGLGLFGNALLAFYIHTAYGGQGGVDITPFTNAVEAAPQSFMAHHLLGWANYRNADAAAAKAAFGKALELNPEGVGAMSGLMWCGVLDKDKQAAGYWAGRKAAARGEDVEAAMLKACQRTG